MPLVVASKKLIKFDTKTFLSTIDGGGRKIAAFSKKQTIFAQGNSADAVFYVQKGKVRLTVVSKTGKEATIGIERGQFLRRRLPYRATSATVFRNCDDRLRRDENRQEVHGGSASP
jgi:CRP/FNR family transcriptional regulator, cyclic AMP receptor protein